MGLSITIKKTWNNFFQGIWIQANLRIQDGTCWLVNYDEVCPDRIPLRNTRQFDAYVDPRFFLTHWRFDVFQCPLAQLEVGGIQRCLSIAVGPKIRCCPCPKLQMMLGCCCSCFGWVFWWTRHTSPWDILLDFCCSIFPNRIPSRSFSHSAIVVVFFRLWDTSPNRWIVFFSNRPEIYLEAYWVATVVVVYSPNWEYEERFQVDMYICINICILYIERSVQTGRHIDQLVDKRIFHFVCHMIGSKGGSKGVIWHHMTPSLSGLPNQ